MVAVAVGIVGGVLCLVGAKVSMDSYFRERQEAQDRADAQKKLLDSLAEAQKGQSALTSALATAQGDLARTNAELSEARRRADALRELADRQGKKYRIVASLIGKAIDSGDGLRYDLETAVNPLRSNQDAYYQFQLRFDETDHARKIETWRGDTADMLDRELPGLGLRSAFSAIDGARGVGPVDFRLSQLLNCMDYLRALQSELPAKIAQVIR